MAFFHVNGMHSKQQISCWSMQRQLNRMSPPALSTSALTWSIPASFLFFSDHMMVFISSTVGLPLRHKISGQSIRGSSAGGLCLGSWLSSAWKYSLHSCGCSLGRLPKFPSVFLMLSFVDLSRSLCLLNKKIFSEARPMTSLNGKLAMCLIDYNLKSMLLFG